MSTLHGVSGVMKQEANCDKTGPHAAPGTKGRQPRRGCRKQNLGATALATPGRALCRSRPVRSHLYELDSSTVSGRRITRPCNCSEPGVSGTINRAPKSQISLLEVGSKVSKFPNPRTWKCRRRLAANLTPSTSQQHQRHGAPKSSLRSCGCGCG